MTQKRVGSSVLTFKKVQLKRTMEDEGVIIDGFLLLGMLLWWVILNILLRETGREQEEVVSSGRREAHFAICPLYAFLTSHLFSTPHCKCPNYHQADGPTHWEISPLLLNATRHFPLLGKTILSVLVIVSVLLWTRVFSFQDSVSYFGQAHWMKHLLLSL